MHARSKTKHAHMLDDFGPTQPKVSVNITLAAHANCKQIPELVGFYLSGAPISC
jgi:hypothetical protein